MAAFTPEELDILSVRGFEPADGYDPLKFTYSHNVTYDMYYTDQESTEFPFYITDVGYQSTLKSSVVGLDKTVWFSKVSSGSDSTPPNAVGLHIVGGTHGSSPAWGDITVYFIDEQGNDLPNPFYITMEGIPEASFDVTGRLAYLVLCYRTDITPPSFHFGINYSIAKYNGFPHDPDDITVLSDRMVHLGYQGAGVPNSPFYEWYYTNRDSSWYDSESQVPDLSEGGGGGGFSRSSDVVGFPTLPTFDICASDFIRLYKLTTAELTNLGNFLWSNSFYDNILKNQQSPFENIISLHLVPLLSEITTTNANIQIGNLDTGVASSLASGSLYEKDFGTVDFNELYANFADYAPFTKLQIYLPYIGKRSLNPDQYMDGKIHLKYQMDILTGSCVAHLMAIRHNRTFIVDSYNGNINTQMPVSGVNYATMYQSQINGLATMAMGGLLGQGGAMLSGLNQMTFAKPDYEKAGTLTGSYGRFAVKTPYIFFDTPQLRAADTYRKLHGYVSNLNLTLSVCRGFTQVKYIDTTTLDMTDTEKQELINILSDGVYINDPPTP